MSIRGLGLGSVVPLALVCVCVFGCWRILNRCVIVVVEVVKGR